MRRYEQPLLPLKNLVTERIRLYSLKLILLMQNRRQVKIEFCNDKIPAVGNTIIV